MNNSMQVKWLSCAETAQLIRVALKRAFPGVKFSVRSSVYSGGASIRVGWIDGPTSKMVEEVAGGFAGGRFDGSIDLKISVRHWLMPDGSVTMASNPGTVDSMGSIRAEREWMPSPEAKLVRFGSDFVFCNRSYSERFIRHACAKLARHGWPEFSTVQIQADGSSAWIAEHRRRIDRAGHLDMGDMLHRECVRLVVA